MKMDVRLRVLLVGLLTVSCVQTGWSGKIVKPWRSTTAIVKAGESFDVWFDADSSQTIESVELQGPYNSVACSKSVTLGDWEYDPMSGNRYDTLLTVTVALGADSTTAVDIFAAGMASNRASFVSWDVPSEPSPVTTTHRLRAV